jgi:hypothetical protein
LLGVAIYHAVAVIAATFQVRLGLVWLIAPVAVIAVVRAVLLPGEMVPRGDAHPARSGLAARALLVGVVLAVLVGPWLATDFPPETRPLTKLHELGTWRAAAPWQVGGLALLPHASLAALVTLVLHGLAQTGVSAFPRRFAAALLLATPILWREDVLLGDDLTLLAYFGAACSLAAVWWQSADPRAMALAAIFFAVTPAWRVEALPLAFGGIALLAAGTHSNARQQTLLWSAGALLLAFPPWHLFGLLVPTSWLMAIGGSGEFLTDAGTIGPGALLAAMVDVERFGLTWILCAAAAVIGAFVAFWRRRGARPFARTLALLLVAGAAHGPMIVAQDVLRDGYLMSWTDALVRMAAAAALLVGLALGLRREPAR